jgi:hypothetical protein
MAGLEHRRTPGAIWMNNFVYVYSADLNTAYAAANCLALARLPKERIRERDAAEREIWNCRESQPAEHRGYVRVRAGRVRSSGARARGAKSSRYVGEYYCGCPGFFLWADAMHHIKRDGRSPRVFPLPPAEDVAMENSQQSR